jgi:hypothetical protein
MRTGLVVVTVDREEGYSLGLKYLDRRQPDYGIGVKYLV